MLGFREYRDDLLVELLRLAPAGGVAGGTGPAAGESPAASEYAFTRPPRPEIGDVALAAFPLAKAWRLPPAEVAQRWAAAVREEMTRAGSRLAALPVPLVKVEAQGPYLNLTFDPPSFARLLVKSVAESGRAYGRAAAPSGQTVMVEYSSPNTNKPLHLGHVRNNLLGMAVANLLEAVGDRVVRVNLVNDRGAHICKSMLAYHKWGRGETPAATGEKGDHFVGRYYVLFNSRLQEEREAWAGARGVVLARYAKAALRAVADREEQRRLELEAERLEEEFLAASSLMQEVQEWLRRWEAGDEQVLLLWRTMNEWVYDGFRQTYSRLGCRFDRWYFESETWQLGKREVERGLESGVFYRHTDGSVWARLTDLGLQDKILLRSDGTSVYITQDLGTAVLKFDDYHMDRSIYVVGSEQVTHFQNLFAILGLLGHTWASRCHHLSYGLVNLPRGLGRLKSREGLSVDADDLLEELRSLAGQKITEGGYCESPELAQATAEQIGQGALKLYILQVSAEKNIQFDPAETIAFTGDTGPAVQYSHARIHGILRKGLAEGKLKTDELAAEAPPPPDSTLGPTPFAGSANPAAVPAAARGVRSGPFLRSESCDPALLSEPEEREVLRLLAEFPDAVTLAARQLSPAPVANALLTLTKAYARMYHQHEVLRAEPPLLRARLQLALCVAQTLRNGLALLGVEAPERM